MLISIILYLVTSLNLVVGARNERLFISTVLENFPYLYCFEIGVSVSVHVF